jgi:hypothetical protein
LSLPHPRHYELHTAPPLALVSCKTPSTKIRSVFAPLSVCVMNVTSPGVDPFAAGAILNPFCPVGELYTAQVNRTSDGLLLRTRQTRYCPGLLLHIEVSRRRWNAAVVGVIVGDALALGVNVADGVGVCVGVNVGEGVSVGVSV